MVGIVPSLVTERVESVKAGIVGAVVFAIAQSVVAKPIAEVLMFLSNTFTLSVVPGSGPTQAILNLEWLMPIIIGAVSGFLFGVTYRYIIRDDRNSHLNDGAVLAFGLVRGLALVEGNLALSELLSLSILVMQSIICFAIARFTIDLAISRKLIKPFI